MSDWKKLLADADEDYLIGIANKGIVKRAYKDKEEGNYQVLSVKEEAKVSVGGENVTIKNPLGESECSCPSRSICRHVVLGILALKEQTGNPENVQAEEDVKNENSTGGLMKEIAEHPFASIKKALGSRQLQTIIGQIKAGTAPQISYANVITVELPMQEQRVRLLSPLEYSTCTCHKKELCLHKAAALLWCKFENGSLTLQDLEKKAWEKTEYDGTQIKEAARHMKQFLEELLNTGLARTSSDVLDHMERLAIISHNARLANFEGYWRTLHDAYESYFQRKASFRVQKLMEQISRLYQRTQLLLEAEDDSRVSELAGVFKAEYLPVGTLDLVGIALEHYENQAGYEGETIYFLEEHTKQWYTYTTARPVFYEKSGRRGKPEKASAPWGLPFSLEELAKARIHLTGAKADMRRRLSSSQESKGELAGDRKKGNALHAEDLGEWYYQDFGKLFAEQVDKKRRSWLAGQEAQKGGVDLVFLRPESCEKAFFSEAEQKLFMSLFDRMGHEVVIEVVYSQQESWGIRYLERITNEKLPCFLGKVYFRDGRIRVYPVAVFERGELVEDDFGE